MSRLQGFLPSHIIPYEGRPSYIPRCRSLCFLCNTHPSDKALYSVFSTPTVLCSENTYMVCPYHSLTSQRSVSQKIFSFKSLGSLSPAAETSPCNVLAVTVTVLPCSECAVGASGVLLSELRARGFRMSARL